MKIRRTERLIDMTHHLIANPVTLVPLNYFASKYDSAKSSISEDLVLVKQTFENRGIGIVETVPGASGGVRYIPIMPKYEAKRVLNFLKQQMENPDRILPGDYVYLSDLLGSPTILSSVGKMIATPYAQKNVTVVMTVATKGVPLAQAVARELGVPFVIVRRDSKVTEGSTVSINYASASSNRVEKMELSKRSLQEGARVLIVDDFLKGGGTIEGMRSLIEEFKAETVGVSVFAEGAFENRRQHDYMALLKVDKINSKDKEIVVSLGNYLEA